MEPKAPHANCDVCPLKDAKFVPSSKPANAKVALVSRSPGANDTDAPFTGPSKDIVDYLLKKYNHSRNNVVLTNVVLCQTDAPPKEAIEACSARLESEIVNTTTIIAAGSEAASTLTKVRSVISGRGFVHERQSNGNLQRVIVTNNPALVLRESDSFPTLITDFKLALDPLPDPYFPTVEIINEPDMAGDTLRFWLDSYSGFISSDLEWSGLDIYCAGFSENESSATVFGRNVIKDPTCFGLLKQFYESDKVSACWHTGKSDTSVLWRNGIRASVDHDTFLLSVALDEEPGRHSLDYLLQTLLGWPYYEPKSVTHFKKTGKLDFYGSSESQIQMAEYELYEYNGWDAAGTHQLFNLMKDMAEKDNVYKRPYLETLLPAGNAFRQIELHGFRFDAEGSANIMEAEVLPTLDRLKVQMQKTAGLALLNPRSNDQLKQLYYGTWGLHHNLRDKAKQKLSTSTGKEVREEIEGGRFTCKPEFRDTLTRFAELHRSFAKVERQRSNYFQPLIERIDNNGYIHPWFNLGGTVTGRTSSTDPNFQNITREGVEGLTPVRTLFLPSPGNVLIQADYSQAELRTMAYLSQDPELLSIYMDNTRSLHKERAAAFYGDNYTKEEYVKSKNINFGVSYGQSAAAFAQMYHMPKEEAQAYIDSWWRQFGTLKKWTYDIQQEVMSGEVIAPLGYKRRFHLITKDNLEDIKREAVNFVPQNTAGGFTIHAVIELIEQHQWHWYLDDEKVPGMPIVNSVHDSIIADVPKLYAITAAKLMKQIMEAQPKKLLGWDLPFTVDVSIGYTWASVKEIENI
jgi:uracil-DNA glycosylase family 4